MGQEQSAEGPSEEEMRRAVERLPPQSMPEATKIADIWEKPAMQAFLKTAGLCSLSAQMSRAEATIVVAYMSPKVRLRTYLLSPNLQRVLREAFKGLVSRDKTLQRQIIDEYVAKKEQYLTTKLVEDCLSCLEDAPGGDCVQSALLYADMRETPRVFSMQGAAELLAEFMPEFGIDWVPLLDLAHLSAMSNAMLTQAQATFPISALRVPMIVAAVAIRRSFDVVPENILRITSPREYVRYDNFAVLRAFGAQGELRQFYRAMDSAIFDNEKRMARAQALLGAASREFGTPVQLSLRESDFPGSNEAFWRTVAKDFPLKNFRLLAGILQEYAESPWCPLAPSPQLLTILRAQDDLVLWKLFAAQCRCAKDVVLGNGEYKNICRRWLAACVQKTTLTSQERPHSSIVCELLVLLHSRARDMKEFAANLGSNSCGCNWAIMFGQMLLEVKEHAEAHYQEVCATFQYSACKALAACGIPPDFPDTGFHMPVGSVSEMLLIIMENRVQIDNFSAKRLTACITRMLANLARVENTESVAELLPVHKTAKKFLVAAAKCFGRSYFRELFSNLKQYFSDSDDAENLDACLYAAAKIFENVGVLDELRQTNKRRRSLPSSKIVAAMTAEWPRYAQHGQIVLSSMTEIPLDRRADSPMYKDRVSSRVEFCEDPLQRTLNAIKYFHTECGYNSAQNEHALFVYFAHHRESVPFFALVAIAERCSSKTMLFMKCTEDYPRLFAKELGEGLVRKLVQIGADEVLSLGLAGKIAGMPPRMVKDVMEAEIDGPFVCWTPGLEALCGALTVSRPVLHDPRRTLASYRALYKLGRVFANPVEDFRRACADRRGELMQFLAARPELATELASAREIFCEAMFAALGRP